jgi:uroporphyrinogen decarboxylase
MTSLERFYKTINREPVDRPACWLGMPDIHSRPALFDYFGVKDMDGLKAAIDDDLFPIEMPYHSPDADAIYAAFNFANDEHVDSEDRTLTSPGFFEEYEDPDKVNDFSWPEPEKYIDVEECKKLVDSAPKDKAIIAMLWSAHFQDTCAAFGMETAMMNMIANPEMYKAIDDKIMDFYLRANKVFYEATKGKIHAVLIGNDMGSQACLMLSPAMIREFILPGAKKLIAQAHSYGLKVVYHSCGSIVDVIPDLIEAGVDAIHPIQALAAGMQPKPLKEKFEGKVSFVGGVDTQDLLVNGSEQDVKDKVMELRSIFPTGLIVSPSHEAVLPDIPPRNIKALFDAAKQI